jgi:hypothetical protein
MAETTHKKSAPMIPSKVFFGEIPWAKGLFPKRLPNRSPPLSAYQDRQNTIEIYFGLKTVTL